MKFPKWLTAISIFVNNITGGPKGWSLCARFWEARLQGSTVARWTCRLTDAVFFFDKQHCRNSWMIRNK